MAAEHHILLVTFPAQGHINPSLQFAKRLTKHGLKVTILTAAFATSRMPKTLPSPLIDVVSFPTAFDNAVYSPDKATELMEALAASGSAAVESAIVSKRASGNPYSRVVFNLLVPWAGQAARRLGVPFTLLWIQPAALFAIYFHYYNKNFDVSDEAIELPGLPRLRRGDLPSFFHESNPSFYDFAIPMFMADFEMLDEEEHIPAVLLNTFADLESEGLGFLKKYRLMPIGPLIPSAFLDGRDPSDTAFGGDLIQNSDKDDYLKYLDSAGAESVIYIAFGSYSELPPRQMAAIAAALIKTGRPFLWVIRGSEEKGKLDEIFTCTEELERRGKIVAWCAQVEVLSHSSVGCFVTHCGWNSTLESLAAGVPVVALPQWSDQGTNAKLVEELWRSGVRAEKKGDAEVVAAEEIERCLERVMDGGEESREMRTAAKKWRDLARAATAEDGTSTVNLKIFVDEIVGGRQSPSV